MQSKLTNKEIRLESYLAETICLRVAKFKNQTLSAGFWKLPQWAKFYKLQMIFAHQLTKIYPPDCVLKGLEMCYFVCTLRDKRLDNAIQQCVDRLPKPIEKSVGTWQKTKKNKLRDI